jgi:adenylate kinase family enzyme
MIALIQERLAASDALDGFVLDGFPGTVDQALALERIPGRK